MKKRIENRLTKIATFFSGVKKEAKRSKWPDLKSMVKYSTAVIVSCIFFALFFTVIDLVIALIDILVR